MLLQFWLRFEMGGISETHFFFLIFWKFHVLFLRQILFLDRNLCLFFRHSLLLIHSFLSAFLAQILNHWDKGQNNKAKVDCDIKENANQDKIAHNILKKCIWCKIGKGKHRGNHQKHYALVEKLYFVIFFFFEWLNRYYVE